jgi:hypothetical protein
LPRSSSILVKVPFSEFFISPSGAMIMIASAPEIRAYSRAVAPLVFNNKSRSVDVLLVRGGRSASMGAPCGPAQMPFPRSSERNCRAVSFDELVCRQTRTPKSRETSL